jgi:hypothetical protein
MPWNQYVAKNVELNTMESVCYKEHRRRVAYVLPQISPLSASVPNLELLTATIQFSP